MGNWTRYQALNSVHEDYGNLGQFWCSCQINDVYIKGVFWVSQQLISAGNAWFVALGKDYVKFLGVLIDKNLTWKYHIDYIRACDTTLSS